MKTICLFNAWRFVRKSMLLIQRWGESFFPPDACNEKQNAVNKGVTVINFQFSVIYTLLFIMIWDKQNSPSQQTCFLNSGWTFFTVYHPGGENPVQGYIFRTALLFVQYLLLNKKGLQEGNSNTGESSVNKTSPYRTIFCLLLLRIPSKACK